APTSVVLGSSPDGAGERPGAHPCQRDEPAQVGDSDGALIGQIDGGRGAVDEKRNRQGQERAYDRGDGNEEEGSNPWRPPPRSDSERTAASERRQEGQVDRR